MSRSLRFALTLPWIALAVGIAPTFAVVPPEDPEAGLPDPAAEKIRADASGAYRPLNPLAGVVPGNVDDRLAAGPLDLTTLSGSFDYPVLPGLFQDSGSAPHPVADVEDQLFQDGYSGNGRPGSLRDYFDEVSYDQYQVGGTVFDWVTAAEDAATYEGDAGCFGLCDGETASAGGFVRDVIELNDAAVDFAQYDNDGPDGIPNSGDDDGVVDLLVVLQPRAGAECGGSGLWSHVGRYSDWFTGSYETDDAAEGGGQILIEDYVLAPAVACDGSALLTIGPLAHLFGLHLGFPPLWDRDGSSSGIGVYGLMGRGAWGGDGASPERPVHPSAYSKALAGWIEPGVVTAPEVGVSLPAVESDPTAKEFRRPPDCAHGEYFLLENRQPTGFDANLPGSGLLVWHADDRVETNDEEERPRLALLPGDDFFGLDNGRNQGDAGDPWPGDADARSWDDGTSPPARRWGDRPSGASFTNLSDSGDPMTLDLDQSPGPLFHVESVTIDDTVFGDSDGVIDPFETVQLDVALSNEGQSVATGVSGTLVLDPPVDGVTVTQPNASWPDLEPCGQASEATFEIELAETVPCETELTFRLDVTSGEANESETFSLRVGDWFLAPETRVTSAADEDAGPPRVAVAPDAAGVVYSRDDGGRRVIELARVDDEGSVLGTTRVSQATSGDALSPDVDWNGTEYGIVWEDGRHGSQEIYFARVGADGSLVGSELRVTDSTGDSRRPRLVWNDGFSEWGLVWQDDRSGEWDVYYTHIDSAGSKIGSDVPVADDAVPQQYPVLAWNGTRFGVVWQEPVAGDQTLWFVPIGIDGQNQDNPRRIETNEGDTIRPEITWDASKANYGVTFIDYYRGNQQAAVRAQRIVAGQSFGVVTIDDGMTRVEGLDIADDDEHYFLSWVDHRDGERTVRMARTDGFLGLEIPGTIVDADAAKSASSALGVGDGRIFTAWLAETPSSARVDVLARPALSAFDCGRDNDGDGVDEPEDNCPATPNPDQIDEDEDGWGAACDCDETDPNVNPAAPETTCDGIDNDCDAGTVDVPNEDGDPADVCNVDDPVNPDSIGADCDDQDPNNYPTNEEVCDGQDNDCDTEVDEDFPIQTWYRDADGDGFGDASDSIETCEGNNQGYVDDDTDCDDTRADVNPGEIEACSDAVDNDCDGSVNEITGARYIAPAGDDGTACTDQGAPCASFNHAIRMACDGEEILVAEGDYEEQVVVDHPVVVDNQGLPSNTTLRGPGGSTVLSILSGDVTWDGVPIKSNRSTTDEICVQVGSETATGLRGVEIQNGVIEGCGINVILDSTGSEGDLNRVVSNRIAGAVVTGAEHSGTGVLLRGGVGRLQMRIGFVQDNAGAGVKVLAPPDGAVNESISIVGNRIRRNGGAAEATSRAGIEITSASDVRIEGNEIHSQTGVDEASEGVGVRLDDVSGINFFCNDVYDNDRGFVLGSGSENAGLLHNFWRNHGIVAFETEPSAGSGTAVNENNFSGNALALDHAGDGTLDARHNWWGAADGPDDGQGGGSGDPVSGSLDTSDFIERNLAPVLVKRPVDFGWTPSVAACYRTIQGGADAAAEGDLLLVGEGTYPEQVEISKPLDIEGLAAGTGCSSTRIDATQSGGSHLPGLRISGVSNIDVRNLTIASAGEGTTCGQNTGDEIGLDLQDVSGSTFENLCLEENGVTELRLYGDSDGNLFRNLSIDGMIRLSDGSDACGHRSREGILVDGGPACEGGSGAIAEGNRFEDLDIDNVVRGAYVRLADDTEITQGTITATPAPAWLGGTSSFGVVVEMADRTVIEGNEIGRGETVDGIRVAGKPAGSCVEERTDSSGTRILDNVVEEVSGKGLHLAKAADDPGAPLDTLIECNDFFANGTGILVEHVGEGTTPNRMRFNDVRQNGEGVRNTAVQTFPAEENFWNASDGPSGAGGGSGDSVFGSVDFTPWLEGSSFGDDDADGFSECAGDCDDQDDSRNPGVEETCDGIDNDCDGSIDEDLPLNTYYRDQDGDGFGVTGDTIEDCADTPPDGYAENPDDCDDADPDVNPNAAEIACDGIDQNCNGDTDETPDADADGYDACAPTDPADGDSLAADCDEGDPSINPGASEIACDGVDQNCSGSDAAPDQDGDGADVCGTGDANNPDGLEADCDDTDPSRSPLEEEVCDDVDNDCDGSVDEGLPLNTFYEDDDGDGFGDPNETVEDCSTVPPPGTADNPDDCNDQDASAYPGAPEICTDGIDNDCDGSADAEDDACSGLEVQDLSFASTGKTTLTWSAAAGADSHALYRGRIPEQGFSRYTHACEGTEIAGTTAEDPDEPSAGESFYYLATGLDTQQDGGVSGGPLGSASDGSTRDESTTISCGRRVHVDPDAAGSGDGLSWADAYTTVSAALADDRTSGRGLEVWVSGNVTDDPATLSGSTRDGARLLGGFAGTESSAWERDPDVSPSTWNGGGAAVLLDVDGASAVIDGMRLEDAGTGVLASIDGQRLELIDARLDLFTQRGVDLESSGGGRLVVTGSRFDASGDQAVRAVVRSGELSGRVDGNLFEGNSDAAVRLEARPGAGDATQSVAVLANEIRGGNLGLALGAHGDDTASLGRQASLVASNLIRGTTGEAIRVEASGSYENETAAATVEAVPLVIGNTLSDGSAAGLVSTASRSDTTADPTVHEVRAAPELWNNLITFFAGIGVEESEDDEAANLFSDPILVRNDLFGNAGPYRDEGLDDLADVGALNALDGARENLAEDPLYVDRPGGDFHLQAGSPVIDEGAADAPQGASRDLDGEARVKDGDGDGQAQQDLGADER